MADPRYSQYKYLLLVLLFLSTVPLKLELELFDITIADLEPGPSGL